MCCCVIMEGQQNTQLASCPLLDAVFGLGRSAMANNSLAQSMGSEWVHSSILAGVIDFMRSVAAAPTSVPTAFTTRQVSQAEWRLPWHSPVTGMLFPPRSSSNET